MFGKAKFDYSGVVVLVTGGSKGIGAGIAEAFAEAGADVVITGRRPEPLREMEERYPGRISSVQMDVGSDADRKRTIATVIERHGRLDVLVNNALQVTTGPFEQLVQEEVSNMFEVLLGGTTFLISDALPHLKESKGCVINVSSIAGRAVPFPPTGMSLYGTAKAGVNHLTRYLGSELGVMGVRVNAIMPGPTNSESAQAVLGDPVVEKALADATPLRRIGEPSDIAGAALFLASDAARWVTGEVMDVAGGWNIG